MKIVNITSLTRPLSRRALPRPNLVYYLWRFVANGARTGRGALTRPSYADTPAIAAELAEQGIVVGPSERFLGEGGRAALREASSRILQTSRSAEVQAVVDGAASDAGRQKDFLVHLVSYPNGMPPEDPLLQVALDRKLLEIVSGYLGLWPCLHAVGAWLNYPTDAPPEQSQLWHRDPEDLKLVKVFIYLDEVDERCGPFTYIPRTHPFGAETAIAQKLERKKRVPDDRMNRVFPPEAWRVCTGPAHTMILADTVGYHRGGKPVAGRRILITFTYTSGAPMTERALWLQRRPAWISASIQRAAVSSLLHIPAPSKKDGKKKKKP